MGAAAALIVILAFTYLSRHVVRVPNPGVFYVLTVACCGFLGGIWAAAGAAPLLCLSIAWIYSEPNDPFTYSPDNRVRLIVILLSLPTSAVLVAVLKSRADRSLAASEARFETFVNALPFGLVVTQGERMVLANPAAVELLRAGSAEQLTGAPVWQTVHPDSRDAIRARMAALDDGAARLEPAEERFLRIDGTVLDAEVSAARVELDRRPARMVVMRDVAPRKAMEARNLGQLHDLSLLHEVSRALLFGLSPSDIPEYLCGLVVERLGVASACLTTLGARAGRPAAGAGVTLRVVRGDESCCPPGGDGPATVDGPAALAVDQAKPVVIQDAASDPRAAAWRDWCVARGHRAAACVPLIGPDRVLAVLTAFARDPAAFDDGRSALLQSLANLAAIALSEAEAKEGIRRSQERLAMAMDAGHMGAFDWDLAGGGPIVWEGNHAGLFGISAAEFDGTYAGFARRVHPDDLPGIERAIDAARRSRSVYEHEYRVVWPDGSHHWVAARGRFVYDDRGDAVRMSGVVMDVDRRRQAEETVRLRQAELAHVQRLTMLSQLASGLAHEITQPLTAIANFAGAGLELRRAGRLTPDAAGDLLAEAHQQAQRAGEIVRRMRGFMQKRGPELVSADVNAVVAEGLALMRPELARAGVRAALHAAPDLPPVRIDPVQVQQVLVNLIQNAVDAMVDAPPDRRAVTVATVASFERVIVRVTDAGPGIPPDDLPRVFDSFYSTKPAGLGMGLNISRSIVESHGGSMTARNNDPRQGGGATLEFVLPIGGST
jgi:PAS domain S-box-containing protein